jgi:hypothetical protein
MLLNFGVQMGTSAFSMVWPLTGPKIWYRKSFFRVYRKQESHCHLGKNNQWKDPEE